MLSIKEIREKFPTDTKGKSDAEVIYMVSRATGLEPTQVAQDFGIEDPENAPRGFLGAANDTVINFSNAAAGGVGAIADFVAPGNFVSKGIDAFIEDGRSKLSLQERLSQDRFSQALDTDDLGTQARGVWDRVKDAPIQTAAQALGNFVVPGASIKGAQAGARAVGLGTKFADDAIGKAQKAGPITPKMGIDIGTKAADKGIERVGLGTGMLLSGAMNAGDAAGTAYDLVLESTGSEELALKAAREASAAPFAVGLATGGLGAERVLARTGKQPLGKGASILGTAGIEAGTEFIEEGTAAYSGRKVASMYDDSINPMTGVFGQSLMGAVQGGMTGAGVATLSKMGGNPEQAAISGAINGTNTTGTDDQTGGPVGGYLSPEEKAEQFLLRQQEREAAIEEQKKQAQANAQLAADNQQVQQAQQGAQQQDPQQQQVETAQKLFDQFGIRPVLNPETNQPKGSFKLGNKTMFTEGDAIAFAQAMTEAGKDLTPAQQSMIGKVLAAGAVPVNSTDLAAAVVSRATKFLEASGLSSSQSLEEAVSRIDEIIESVGPNTDMISSKPSKDAEFLGTLDRLRKEISGQESTRLGEIADEQLMGLQQKEAEKAAKGGKNSSKTTGGPNGQQGQNTTGLGSVPVQDAAGTATQSGSGNVGPTDVESLGAGSVAQGSDGQQNDGRGNEGDGQRALQPGTDVRNVGAGTDQEVNSTDTNNGVVDGQQTEGQQQTEAGQSGGQVQGAPAVGEGQPTGQSEGQTVRGHGRNDDSDAGRTDTGTRSEETAGQNLEDESDAEPPSLFRKVLEYVFVEMGGNKGKATAARKVAYIDRYYGVPTKVRDESAKKFAQKYNVKTGTVVGWRKLISDMPDGRDRFSVEYGAKMKEAAKVIAEREGISFEEMLEAVQARAKAAREARQKQDEADSQLVDDSNQAPVQDEDGAVELDTNDRAGLDTIVSRDKTTSNEAYADEVTNDGEDGGEQSGSVIKSPGANSVSEFGNKGEGIARRWERLSKKVEELEVALDEAQMEGDDAKVDELQAQLKEAQAMEQKLFADAEAEQRKSNRKNTRAGKEESATKETESKPPKKAATKAKAEKAPAPKKIENTKEAAGQQWDKVADSMDGAPKWAELSEDQQDTFFEFGPENWTENDVVQELAKIARVQNSINKDSKGDRYKADDLRKEVTDFIGVDNAEKLVVLQSAKDIPKHILKANPDAATAQGFVYGNRAYLIADNIKAGRGKAVFLHEVGAHLGLDETLGDEFGKLVDQIYAWAKADDGSLESQLAKKAQARVRNADSPTDQLESELVAYFIEEAVLSGVDPSAKSSAGKFLKTIIDKFKQALRLLGINPQFMSAQDVVDLAYGAARLELSGAFDGGGNVVQASKSAKFSMPSNAVTPAQESRIERNLERIPKKVRPVFKSFSNTAARLMNNLRFTGHILEQAAKIMPAARRYLELTREQTALRAKELREVERISEKFHHVPKPMQNAVFSLLMDSTRSTKWAFEPSWLKGTDGKSKVTVDPALAERYNKLDDNAKQIVREVFANGYVSMEKLRAGAIEAIDSMYGERIEIAKRDGDTKRVAELEAEMQEQLADYSRLFADRSKKPYAPLRRFGNHAVVFRSEEMLTALDIVERGTEGGLTKEQVAAAKKFVRQNEGNPEHYQLHFRESSLEAERLAQELQDNSTGATVQSFTRSQLANEMYTSADIHGLMYRLRKKSSDVVDGMDDSKGARALADALTELHLSLLSEQNARHSEHRRVEGGVEGAEKNMMRAFHDHGMATASLIASLHKSKEIQKSLEAFEKQANDRRAPDREKRTALYNEVAARHGMGLDTKDSPVTDTVLKYNSAWMLLTKPTYYLQNAMQPWMMSLPVLSGRFGLKAAPAMAKAFKDIAAVMGGNRLTHDMLDKLPNDIQRLVGDLLDQGRLNISLDQDMGNRLRGTNVADRAITKLQGMVERLEGFNRVGTAAAAYRLARSNKMSHAEAVKYAGDVVYDTHGDYSGFNAPRIMRSQVGRVVTQFRKFQLIQIGMIAKLGREAFMDKSVTDTERQIARRALGYTLGTAFAMGGMYALPGAMAITWILGKIFGDADEPNDPEAIEAKLRRAIGDPDLADMLLRGMSRSVLGLQDGQALGLGDWGGMLSLIPYTKVESADRSTYMNIMMGLSGAFVGGTLARGFEGVGKFAEGDIAGGLQRTLPSGVANLVKAMELADKGLTRKAGTEILSPDDVSEWTVFLSALGLRSNEVVDKEFINRVTSTYDAYYRQESQRVKQSYVEAFKEGDTKALVRARERWNELNESRRRNGFDAQPFSSLIKAPMQARKYEQRVNRQLDNTGRQLAGMR
jgi:hypothetical protein